jgi:hypothetical protein
MKGRGVCVTPAVSGRLPSRAARLRPVLSQQSFDPAKEPTATTVSNPSGGPASPDLTVAALKMQGGVRISKLIGSAVYNDQNEKVGSVDDLLMKDGAKVAMPGATKDTLNAMPTFTYEA